MTTCREMSRTTKEPCGKPLPCADHSTTTNAPESADCAVCAHKTRAHYMRQNGSFGCRHCGGNSEHRPPEHHIHTYNIAGVCTGCGRDADALATDHQFCEESDTAAARDRGGSMSAKCICGECDIDGCRTDCAPCWQEYEHAMRRHDGAPCEMCELEATDDESIPLRHHDLDAPEHRTPMPNPLDTISTPAAPQPETTNTIRLNDHPLGLQMDAPQPETEGMTEKCCECGKARGGACSACHCRPIPGKGNHWWLFEAAQKSFCVRHCRDDWHHPICREMTDQIAAAWTAAKGGR